MYSTKRLRLFLIRVGQPTIGGLIGLAAASAVLFWRLGSLVPGFSRPEHVQLASSQTISGIINNPLNAPYKLVHYGLNGLYHQSPFVSRGVSVLVGLVVIFLFYYVLSQWHSVRIALLGTILFASSSWFLHYARLATPDILLTLIVAALAYGAWIRTTQRSALVIILGVFIAACLVYIPGLIWFVIAGGIWQRRAINEHIKHAQITLMLVAVLGLVLMAPLISALVRQPLLVKQLAGLPAHAMPSPYDIFRHIINVPFEIFFRGPNNPVVWLGRLPLLDMFGAAMSVLGLYASYFRRGLDRTKILFGILIIGTVLVGLRGSVSTILLLAPMYFLATAGIDFMLDQWLRVFPRNPLARSLGTVLIIAAVTLSSYYNLRRYFVAWPGAPVTKQVFNLRS